VPDVRERLQATIADPALRDILGGEPRTVVPLEGGLTNFNFKVETPQCTAVVRLSSSDGDLLAIDRMAEEANSRRAAESGAAPPVLAYLPSRHALVVEWIEGRTLAADDLRDSAMLARVAAVCRQLHAGPRFVGDFDMFAIQRRYLALVRERGFRLPERYLDFAPQAAQVEDALAVRREPTVPCNNDLLAGNFVDDGEKLWLIDYEYSGNNDACFELGNTATECELDRDQVEALATAYFGRALRNRIARVRLQSLVSQYGWALWGCIQASASSIDFDFDALGRERFEKAARTFTGPEFERLLEEVCRDD
jgi:thiamine kinase-like enzyme